MCFGGHYFIGHKSVIRLFLRAEEDGICTVARCPAGKENSFAK